MPGFVSHVEAAWEEPRLARFLRRLASFSRLIVFDKRGTGMSDPVAGLPTQQERLDDVRAVTDAAGSERAAIFAVSEGGPICALFAATYPDRVSKLVMFGAFAKVLRSSDFPWGWSEEFFEKFVAGLEASWADGAELRNPSLRGDERYRRWFAHYLRLSASPGMVRDRMQMNAKIDIRPVLASLATPVLLLHRTSEPWVNVGQSRYMAAHIPGAKLIELDGVDHWPWIGDSERLLDEVEEFLTGTRPKPSTRATRAGGALTSREKDVVRLAIEGYSAPQIGRKLFISERTVETHLANAYAKLGVESRFELIRRAGKLKL